MGDIADMMLDGILDEQTGEYLGKAIGYPRTLVKSKYNTIKPDYKPRGNKKPKGKYRKTAPVHLTPVQKKIASIRKEIAIMVNEQSIGIQEARKQMNIKYGKGWRERGLVSNSDDQWSEEDLKEFQ